jgi:copper(I)-binding protein
MTIRRRSALAAAVAAAGLLTACASGTTEEAASPEASAPAATGCALTVVDPWVKATDEMMTGAFGTIQNTGAAEAVVTGASSPAAGMMEIHEVVDKDGTMVMQPKAGGLVIPAGGSAMLAPGQDHLMLMQLPAPIEAGAEVAITLACADGGTVAFTAVAKPFEGGAETYVPGEGQSMDMSASPSAS